MAYRFKLTEPFDDGVRRIALQQIDRALERLAPAVVDKVEGPKSRKKATVTAPGKTGADVGHGAHSVHDVRKRFKRLRALLRLARSGLGDKVYAQENARYRDCSRLLSAARDGHVIGDTLALLEASATGRTKAAVRAALARNAHGAAAVPEPVAVADVIGSLQEGRAIIASLAIEGRDYEAMFDRLERVYRQGKSAYEEAVKADSADAFHECRKRIQYHWRHMMLIKPVWPEMIDARIETARTVSQLLGTDHDLAQLRARLADGRLAVTTKQAVLIDALAGARQDALRLEARPHIQRLFAETPAALAARMRHTWTSARADAATKA